MRRKLSPNQILTLIFSRRKQISRMIVLVEEDARQQSSFLAHWLAQLSDAQQSSIFCTRAYPQETPAGFARRLFDEIESRDSKERTTRALMTDLAFALRSSRYSFLIVEQAELLQLETCICLRSYICEDLNCPVLLVGHPQLKRKLGRDEALSSSITLLETGKEITDPFFD